MPSLADAVHKLWELWDVLHECWGASPPDPPEGIMRVTPRGKKLHFLPVGQDSACR